jgi:hypothetical protein
MLMVAACAARSPDKPADAPRGQGGQAGVKLDAFGLIPLDASAPDPNPNKPKIDAATPTGPEEPGGPDASAGSDGSAGSADGGVGPAPTGGPVSYCAACLDDVRSCTRSGESCSFQLTDPPETVTGRCQGFGNGCGFCAEECDPHDTCGNDVDDDCNGMIDDGCAGRTCSTSAQCPAGQRCDRGYCNPCETSEAACTPSGESCRLQLIDPPQTVEGRCRGYGNGCGTCTDACDEVETCGNDADDDCNGMIDDGCAGRKCSKSSQCPKGSRCDEGYCTACENAGTACAESGKTCMYQGTDPPVPMTGRCQGFGNGCGICADACETTETCANDIDDDCNGMIDDGCAGRTCTKSSECPAGQRCSQGYCMICGAGDASCTKSGQSCTFQTEDPAGTIMGKCQGYGNGCGACAETCDKQETCGNDVDDDCNGMIDDGCAGRTCTDKSQCGAGAVCRATQI